MRTSILGDIYIYVCVCVYVVIAFPFIYSKCGSVADIT